MQDTYDADLSLFINGSWRIGEGRDLFPVVDPASGEAIGEVPMASPADLDEALDAADKGFKVWRATPADQRGAVLKKAAVLLRERVEPIARLLTLEQGKPIAEARAEVLSSAQFLEWCGEEAPRIYGRTLVRPTGQRALVTRQPIGPVAAFKDARVVARLPKTRSGKILRGAIRKLADGVEAPAPPTIDDPAILDEIRDVLRRI